MASTKRAKSAETNETVARARRRRDWRPPFLKALADQGTVSAACKAAKVSRAQVYRERQANEDFALAMHDVREDLADSLEHKAVEMALDGGSERMIEFLLKALRPETFRETHKVEHSGTVRHDLAAMSDDELQALAAGIDAKRERE